MENTLAGVAGKKFILSYSCGKDSTLCLHKMLEAGAEPMALLVMFNPEAGRSYFHGVDPALLREYGEALELPLLAVPTGGEEYHLSMEAALRRAQVQSHVTERENGTFTVTLALRDDVDSLMHLELMMADRDSADKLAKRFQKEPEAVYAKVIQALCEE